MLKFKNKLFDKFLCQGWLTMLNTGIRFKLNLTNQLVNNEATKQLNHKVISPETSKVIKTYFINTCASECLLLKEK